MAYTKTSNIQSLVSPSCTFGYPFLFRTDSGRQYSDDRYKVNIELPTDHPWWEEVSTVIKRLSIAEFKNVAPNSITPPIKQLKSDPSISFVTAKATKQPQIVDSKRKPITEEVPLGHGEGHVAVLLVPYQMKQGRSTMTGCAVKLMAVQVTKLGITSHNVTASLFEEVDTSDVA